MIIDFHTHIFPDKIAQKTIDALSAKGGIPAYLNGTLPDLISSMKEASIDLSVVLPVVTNPSQFETINNFAQKLNSVEGLVSFGGIHPDNEDIEQKLDLIKSLGLKGIKLHPDYQGAYIEDPKYYRIIKAAVERGLYITIHAGLDVAYPNDIHCPPEKSAKLIKAIYENEKSFKPYIILAHLGGNEQFDDVEKHLVGLPVYLDLAVILNVVSDEQLIRIIRNHGADKILFGTDSPWHCQKTDVEHFLRLPLTAEEKEKILFLNGKRILGL